MRNDPVPEIVLQTFQCPMCGERGSDIMASSPSATTHRCRHCGFIYTVLWAKGAPIGYEGVEKKIYRRAEKRKRRGVIVKKRRMPSNGK